MHRWLLICTMFGLVAGTAAGAPVLRWSPPAPTVDLGGELTMSIMLDDAVTVRTFELYVTYDSSLVSNVAGQPGALFTGHNLFAGFEEVDAALPGQWHAYCVILGASDWATGPGELYRWTLRGLREGATALMTATITLLPPGGGRYAEVLLPPATVVVVNPASAVAESFTGTDSLALYPNPFNPRVQLDCRANRAAGDRLDVFDARGRLVSRLSAGGTATDRLVFAWDGHDDAGRALPSGVYVFVATSPDGERTATRGTLLR